MRQSVLKSLYDVHSWIGLFLGLLLYVLLFSGSVALFVHELQPWQWAQTYAERALPAAALDVAATQAATLIATEAPADINFSIIPASRFQPWIVISSDGATAQTLGPWYFDPITGREVQPVHEQTLTILERLHTDLLLPSPYGRYLVGVLGIAMLVSIISGVLMHRKIFKEMWSLRLWRSQRLKWADLHKSVAVWALPFHLVISFTGAFLGLVGLLSLLVAFIAFRGDVDAATAALSGPESVVSGNRAQMRPIGELLAVANTRLKDFQPELLMFKHYGDASARLQILGKIEKTLIYYPGVTVDATNGSIVEVSNWRQEHWPKALYGAMTPLHYGSYGGLLLKLVYAVLGVGCCFLVISGLRIWQLRVHPTSRDIRLPLITGTCYGLPAAIATLLLSSRTLYWEPFASYEWRLAMLLGTWVLAVGWAYLRKHKQPARELILLTGMLLTAAACIGLASPRLALPEIVSIEGSPYLATEFCLLLLGLSILGLGFTTRARRPDLSQ